jgi:hypothetical protein
VEIIIIIIGKRPHFEPQPSLKNSARFVYHAVLNIYKIMTLASIISGIDAGICGTATASSANSAMQR